MSLDAMKLALEALEHEAQKGNDDAYRVERDALRAAIEQPRQWQGLTDEELDQAMDYWSDPSRSAYGGADRANGEYVDMKETWRYIEAKLKAKNS